MSQAAVAVEGERVGRCGDPCVMVIFGAAGDLTRRKLIPALYNLAKYNLLSREFAVVGLAAGSGGRDVAMMMASHRPCGLDHAPVVPRAGGQGCQ